MYLLQVPLDQLPSPTEADGSNSNGDGAHNKNKGPRACKTCAKAKSRCIPGPSPDKCERCHRLNKPCSSQTPAPPRKRRSPKPTRVSQLERRLEDLTARLDSVSRGQGPTPPDSAGSPASGSSLEQRASAASQKAVHGPWNPRLHGPRYAPFNHLFPLDQVRVGAVEPTDSPMDMGSGSGAAAAVVPSPPTAVNGRVESVPASPEGASPTPPAPATTAHAPAEYESIEKERRHKFCPFVPPGQPEPEPTAEELEAREPLWPRGQEAESLLEEYRAQLVPLFPFVALPAGVPSRELRVARPLLWKAVMMEACHLDGARQMALGAALLGELSAAALTAPRRGIDVLQALELLVAWYNYGINSFQTTNLLYLARSIAYSLKSIEAQLAIKGKDHGPQVLEEMRAFLGAFYISSLVFVSNKKIDGLMDTTMVEACCRVLEHRMELPSDEFLLALVRIQLLSQKLSIKVVSIQSCASTSEEDIRTMVKHFEQEIDVYRASLTQNLRDNDAINSHVQVARLILYEIGMQVDQLGIATSAETRLLLLWSSLTAVKDFFMNRFAQDIRNEPRFICLNSYEYMYCFLLSLKLITLRTPGWDPQVARRMLNFDEYLDRQISDMLVLAQRRRRRTVHIGDVMDQGSLREGFIDPFDRLAQRMTFLRSTLVKELDGEFPRDAATTTNTTTTTTTTSPVSEAPVAAEPSPLVADTGAEPMAIDSGLMSQFDSFQDWNSDAWADMLGPGGWDSYLNMPFSDLSEGIL